MASKDCILKGKNLDEVLEELHKNPDQIAECMKDGACATCCNRVKTYDEVIGDCAGDPTELIHCLQLIQNEFGYISEDAVKAISNSLHVPESEIFSVVTFYSQFTLKPKAKYNIEVCMGTACYVLGASKSIKKFEEKLGIKVGEQTKDNKFALCQSRCLGCCGLAPVISINGQIHGKVTEDKVDEILSKLD